jgi:protein-S-isoprenylcysteine O-methyltransferase Ste14
MIFLGGYVPPSASFPLVSVLLYIIGCGLAVASFLSLGKGFGVLPALRQVTTSGPYRYIRHPAYLGEGLYAIGIMLFRVNWMTGFILVVTIVLAIMRIIIEERVLSKSSEYKKYCKRTRYRLIPGIW